VATAERTYGIHKPAKKNDGTYGWEQTLSKFKARSVEVLNGDATELTTTN